MDLNHRPAVYETAALPAELRRLVQGLLVTFASVLMNLDRAKVISSMRARYWRIVIELFFKRLADSPANNAQLRRMLVKANSPIY